MNKTILFVPGFEEGRSDRDYDALIERLEKLGYAVEFVSINWQKTTQKDWLATLMDCYKKYDPAQTILAGFSFGAVTALLAAAERAPSELWLFSLSPLFAEWADEWTDDKYQHLLAECRQTSLSDVVTNVQCPIKLFAGELELKKWYYSKEAFDQLSHLSHCQSFVVPSTGHAVEEFRYVEMIVKNVEPEREMI